MCRQIAPPEPEGATVDLGRAALRAEALLISNLKRLRRRAVARERQDEEAERFIARGRSLIVRAAHVALTVTG